MANHPNSAVMTSLTGRMVGEETWGSQPHLTQLCDDLMLLTEREGPPIRARVDGRGKITVDLSPTGPIATLRKAQTNKVMSYISRCEEKKTRPEIEVNPEEMFSCDAFGCSASFRAKHRLQTHRVKTHGYRDLYRNLIVDDTCPMCKGKFASIHGAKNHIQTVCGTKGTEEERAEKVRRIRLERQVKEGKVTPISAAFQNQNRN